MNDLKPIVVPLACALGLTLLLSGCREDLGCPPGTVLVGGVCEAAPDMGTPVLDGGDDACTPTNFYPDTDADGAGAGEPVSACSTPEGYADNDDDCDDTCAVCNTGAEVCDGEDNDCDGEVDEDIAVVCGTNEGECSTGTQLCVGGVLGACEGGVEPAIAEVCEGTKDENCDGEVDEDCDCAVGQTRDCGTDVGQCALGTQTCTAAGVYGDCEGATGPINEMCNGLDDDCDGVDDNGNPGGGAVCGTDTGECVAGVLMCVGGDVVCTGSTGPQPETCNGLDDDCSNGVDEGVRTTFYRDQDGDGRGAPGITMQACARPVGYVTNFDDCNDMCSVCWSGNAEVCDAQDNNCSGASDETFTCAVGANVACTTTCGTMGTGTCTATCEVPDAGWCSPPSEVCNGMDDDCDGHVDNGIRTFAAGVTGPLGSAAKLASDGSGFVGILRYNDTARLYRINSSGTVTHGATTVDSSDVVSVDIARISNTQWVTASAREGSGVNVRLVGLSSGAPTSQDVELANNSGTNGVARVAAHSSTDAMTVFQSGSTIRVSHIDFAGAVAPSVELPGSNPRGELGMDILARGGEAPGYIVTWVSGTTPSVNLAVVSRDLEVTMNGVVGAGTNPVLASEASGLFGVAYVGPDGRARLHILYPPTLTCMSNFGPRTGCAFVTSQRTVASPVGAGTFNSTLDLSGTEASYWLVARTTDGELVQRVGLTVYEEVFRSASTTSWMSVETNSVDWPVIARGGGAGYNHNFLGCAP
jgi:hypothetical protein